MGGDLFSTRGPPLRPRMPVALPAVVLTVCLTSSSPAEAVTFEASTSPAEVAFGSTREVTYRIDMVGGPVDEVVDFQQSPPSWPHPVARPGTPAYPIGTSLEGPGDLMPGPIAVVSPPALASRGLILRCGGGVFASPEFGARTAKVRLPAGARSTLVMTWQLSNLPPFPSTDYRPRVTAASGGQTQTVVLPQPRVVGPTGVSLRLLGDPPGRAGRTLRIRGRTDPALAGERISLRLVGPVSARREPAVVATPGRFRTVARVRVDRLGRFEYRWRPSRGGFYGAYPVYLGKPGILRDRACPIAIRVR